MLSYLALGDSYTIGEQVLLSESFPYQTLQLLRTRGLEFTAPEIIAKTGWTTDELSAAISDTKFLPRYNLVTLLIGVNNQYQGRSAADFEGEFEALLKLAIDFAGGQNKNIFVLSIPDWGVTPFAEGRDRAKITLEIDAYNTICKNVAAQYQCIYIDITDSQRADSGNAEMLASDGLHPSGKEYAKWAKRLADEVTLPRFS